MNLDSRTTQVYHVDDYWVHFLPHQMALALELLCTLLAGQKLLQGMPALQLWTTWRSRPTGYFKHLVACETRESTGDSCSNWAHNDETETLSLCPSAAIS